MPDIAKCPGEYQGEICPLRDKCHRYVAPPSDQQAWMMPATFGDYCEDYWPVKWEPKLPPQKHS